MHTDVGIINVREMNSQDRQDVISKINREHAEEICGICQERGVEVFWFNPISRGGHAKCVKIINTVECKLFKLFETILKDKTNFGDLNTVLTFARKAVQDACRPGTIKSYFEKNGRLAVAELFNTVGFRAGMQCVHELVRKEYEEKVMNLLAHSFLHEAKL